MSLIRRVQVIGGVVVASAAAGATSVLLVTGLMLAAKLGHARPPWSGSSSNWVARRGATFGMLLGPPTVLGFLRRI